MAVKKLKLALGLFIFFFLVSMSYSLTTFKVTEGDLVKIESSAIDPDEDEMFYYYSPPLNESGEWQTTLEDAGIYQTKIIVSDGENQIEEEVTIVVQNKNRAPEIEDKKITVEEGETIDLKPLTSDPDNDPLKLIFEEPFDEEGIWQTTFDDAGAYSTLVVVSDLDDKVEQEIEIEVKEKNREPEIIASFSEDGLFLLKEDSTAEFSVSAQDPDEDSLEYFWQLDGEKVSQESLFSYYFDFDTAGEHLLALTVSDQKSEVEESWDLEIENLNRAPKIELPEIIINEGEKIVLQLPETDADEDAIEYTFQLPFEEGVWQTTFDDAGTHTTIVTAFDGELTSETKISITINDVDLPPEISFDEEIVVNESEKLIINMKDLIVDPDGDELSIIIGSLPEGAVFSDNVLEWEPDYNFVQRKSNFFMDFLNTIGIEKNLFFRNKDVKLLVTACGKELCREGVLEIQVDNVNRKPLLVDIKDITLTETETVILELEAADPDNDCIKYKFEEPFSVDGIWITDYNDAGEYFVTVSASDGDLTDSKEVKVTVLNKNRPPTLGIEKDYFKLKEDQPISIKIEAVDPDGDELTIRADNLPKGAVFDEQVFSWKPSFDVVNENGCGRFVVDFVALDGEFEMIHPVTIEVKNVNRAPELISSSPVEELTVNVDGSVMFSAKANDADGDELTYQWSFGFWDKKVKSTNTIQRTFKTPGIKIVKIEVSDGVKSVEKEWAVEVKALPVTVEEEVESVEEEIEEEPVVEVEEKETKVVEEKEEAKNVEEIAPEKPKVIPVPIPPAQPPFNVYVIEG